MQRISELSDRFGVAGAVRFEEGTGGVGRVVVETGVARGVVYLHGGQVAEYQPAGERPVLFMSGKSLFEAGRPIRGGAPICFPWFGPRAGDPAAPMHGFARIMGWEVESVSQRAEGAVEIVLGLRDSQATRELWPVAFEIRHIITMGRSLKMALEVRNLSDEPMRIEEALHTYFAVADVRQIGIVGLEGTTFIDKTDGMKRKRQEERVLRIAGETDRMYFNTRSSCVIEDPGTGRRIVVEKEGSETTVVWNPWIGKAEAMADFGDEEWPGMVCVETANAGENAVSVGAGQVHGMEVGVSLG